ncbi:MAG: hypothetical protein ACAI25_12195 [Planctomycetota bacterium]
MAPSSLKIETQLFLQQRQLQAMVSAYQRELPPHIRTYATKFARAYAVVERNLNVVPVPPFRMASTGRVNNFAETMESVTQKMRGVQTEMLSGCSELQSKVLAVLDQAMDRAIQEAKQGYPGVEEYWKVDSAGVGLSTKIVIDKPVWGGRGLRLQVPYHNSVRVQSKLKERGDDLVFDPWITLTPVIYTLAQWQRKEHAGAHWQQER